MKAAVLTRIDHPFELQEVDDPRPGPGQVRIRVHASGLCGTDVHVLHGQTPFPVATPLICGHEPTGVIDEVGPGVTRLNVGDRVGVSWWQGGCGRCPLCQGDRGMYCRDSKSWVSLGGGNGELMIAEDRGCTVLPDGISFEDAAPVFCAGYTVLSGYRNAAPRPGDRVGVLGIGGLGHLAIQYAKALGHEVVAVTSSEDKRNLALELGADEVVVTGAHAGKALWRAGGVDILLGTSNSMEQTSQALFGLRPEGRLVLMAISEEAVNLHAGLMLVRQLSVKGSMQNRRADLMEALQLVADGKVKMKLELYPLEKINDAFARLEAGKVRFRAVIQHRAE